MCSWTCPAISQPLHITGGGSTTISIITVVHVILLLYQVLRFSMCLALCQLFSMHDLIYQPP